MRRRPRLWFSFRSPYSWLAVRRLVARAPDLAGRVDWLPYWDPDARTASALEALNKGVHYHQMSKAKHLYLLMDTKRITMQEGVRMSWPVDVDPLWEVPHLAFLLAGELGQTRECYDAIVDARWSRAEDVCDPAVLARVCTNVGLDGDLLAGAHLDPTWRERGVAVLADAWDDDIFGIPYLRIGRGRFWGLDRVDAAIAADRAVDAVATRATADRNGYGPAQGYDTDTAGGCG